MIHRALLPLLALAACAPHRPAPVAPVVAPTVVSSMVPHRCATGDPMPVHRAPGVRPAIPNAKRAAPAPMPNACAATAPARLVWTGTDSVVVLPDSAGPPR